MSLHSRRNFLYAEALSMYRKTGETQRKNTAVHEVRQEWSHTDMTSPWYTKPLRRPRASDYKPLATVKVTEHDLLLATLLQKDRSIY